MDAARDGVHSPEPLRREVFDLLERVDRHARLPRVVSGALVALILVNVVTAIFETVESLWESYRWLFHAVEYVSLVVFSVEYVVRLWVSVEHPRARGKPAWQARLSYAVTPAALVDLVAILPFFLEVFTDAHLEVLVLVRLLRLFKLGRYSTGFQSLFEAIRRERQALLASFIILISVMLVAASFAYMAERDAQPDKFGSIPEAIWWAVTTLTTVGYGDVVPHTIAGRIIGGLTMMTGILMIALPVAIIGSSFTEVVRQRSFVITFSMVARIPLFANIGTQMLSEIVPHLRAMTIESGTVIVEPEQGDESLYVIADGVVEVDFADGERRRLAANDAFGAAADADPAGHYSALAVTRVKLLALSRSDLRHAVSRHPELAERLRPAVITVG
ncbi:MAG TPA: cyclic nucleotide-gated ion channel [Bauldia sp.]|nr:cyclic nucleotide-gated ion channel [Bauldia sp.]